jgi:diguanylate cyclase (GGDEF)-like protein
MAARGFVLPSASRIAALILMIAAITILVLAVLVVSDVRLETDLNREVIGAQQAKDGLEALRSRLHELRYAARDYALTGRAESLRMLERRAIEVDADLSYLEERSRIDPSLAATIGALSEATKAFALHSRAMADVARTRGVAAARALEAEQESVEMRAWSALERSLEAQTRLINERSLQQIRIGEHLNGYVMWLLAGSVTLLGGLFAVFQHAQARNREAQRRIERLAHYDVVTGLPNRSLLADRLQQEIARSARSNDPFAIAMFDLDGFKDVNDTMGHAAGDKLLAIVAKRARESVRASDTMGRLGGDEFLALLPNTSREGAMQAAEKIRGELSQPYDIGGKAAHISASVGVSLFPEHGSDPDALLRAADAALYAAKRAGKNRSRVAGGPA